MVGTGMVDTGSSLHGSQGLSSDGLRTPLVSVAEQLFVGRDASGGTVVAVKSCSVPGEAILRACDEALTTSQPLTVECRYLSALGDNLQSSLFTIAQRFRGQLEQVALNVTAVQAQKLRTLQLPKLGFKLVEGEQLLDASVQRAHTDWSAGMRSPNATYSMPDAGEAPAHQPPRTNAGDTRIIEHENIKEIIPPSDILASPDRREALVSYMKSLPGSAGYRLNLSHCGCGNVPALVTMIAQVVASRRKLDSQPLQMVPPAAVEERCSALRKLPGLEVRGAEG